MKLIEIIKKNIIAAVAVATVVGFSAFTLSNENSSIANDWYWVDPNDGETLIPGGQAESPDNCPDDGEETCALRFTLNPGEPFPTNVAEAKQMAIDNKLTIHDETFRP